MSPVVKTGQCLVVKCSTVAILEDIFDRIYALFNRNRCGIPASMESKDSRLVKFSDGGDLFFSQKVETVTVLERSVGARVGNKADRAWGVLTVAFN